MSDLIRLEKVKAHFLKRMLGVATTTPNSLVYELSKEPFLSVNYAPAEQKHLEIKRKKKREETWIDFYTKVAMLERKWEQENQDFRHLFTRLAIHGFHHKICNSATYRVKTACTACTENDATDIT